MFKIWPILGDITTMPSDTNKLLQEKIDIVFALGGDGTLLNLLGSLYKYYSKEDVPPIAAFNLVSTHFGHL